MSKWTVTRLTNWTGAGGVADEDLGFAGEGSTIRQELSGRGGAQFELAKHVLDKVRGPYVVRVDVSATEWHEFRLSGRQHTVTNTKVIVRARPPIYDLTSADLVREVIGGETITRFDQSLAPLTPRQIFQRFVFTNLVEDGLSWFEMLTIEPDEPLPIRFDRWTRGQVIDDTQQRTQYEQVLERQSNNKYALSLVEEIGRTAIVVPADFGDRLQAHDIDDDWQQLSTVARISGEPPTSDSEAATIGENLWRVANVRALGVGGTTPFAVELRRIFGVETPVLQDGQYATPTVRFLQRADGRTRLPIVNSRAALGEVDVANDPPVIGEYVALVANADGDPLELLELPKAIKCYGRFVGDFPVTGGRGERNYATNGGHETGLDGWTPVNGTDALRAEQRRAETGIVFAALTNGTRAAGTPGSTPFNIDGGTSDFLLGKGDLLEVGGAQIGIANDAIPNPAGLLTLSLSSGIPGDLVDGTPVVLERREVRTLYSDGVQSRFATGIKLRPPADGGLLPYPGLTQAEPLGATLVQSGMPLASFERVDQPMGRHGVTGWMRVPQWARLTFGFQGASDTNPYVDVSFTPLSMPTAVDADTFTCVVDAGTFPVGITTASVMCVHLATTAGYFDAFRFVSRVGSVTTWTRVTGWRDADDVAFPCTLAEWPYWQIGGVYTKRNLTNQTWADNTAFVYTRALERRTFLVNGLHGSGATTLSFKPVMALATRDFINGDTISLQFEVTGKTLDLGSGGTVTATYDLDLNRYIYIASVPFNAATSTFDDLPTSEWQNTPAWFLNVAPLFAIAQDASGTGTRWWKLVDLSGGIATFECVSFATGDAPDPSDPITASQLITCEPFRVIDTYTNTAPGPWGTNGRATCTVAIPAGRTYRRGAPVWANWHGNGAMGAYDNAATNLRVNVTVTGSAASIELFGDDAYTRLWDGVTPQLRALYRVFASGSLLPIPGNRLFVASAQETDGAGAAALLLTGPNATAIANNEPIVLRRPQALRADERQLGSVMRLFAPVGGAGVPVPSTPGISNILAYVRVPEGSLRTLTAAAEFALSVGPWTPADGPVLAIVDASGAILASVALANDFGSVDAEPGDVRIACQATITESGTYTIRVYGGSSTDFTKSCRHKQTMWCVGHALDVPYTPGAHASNTLLVGARPFLEASETRISDRVTMLECDAAYARALGVSAAACPPLVLGGRIDLLQRGRQVRVLGRTLRPDLQTSEIDVGSVLPDSMRALAKLTTLAKLRGIQ